MPFQAEDSRPNQPQDLATYYNEHSNLGYLLGYDRQKRFERLSELLILHSEMLWSSNEKSEQQNGVQV